MFVAAKIQIFRDFFITKNLPCSKMGKSGKGNKKTRQRNCRVNGFHGERKTGLEPATYSLEGCRSAK